MPIIAGLFGLIIGSFLNVLILRRGVKSINGRSACMSCGREIVWYDNVPVLSWILLRGRCRECKSGISIQYPLVELATGALFALLASSDVSSMLLIVGCTILALYVAIAVYDLRHTIIPDEWVYTLALLSLGFSFLLGADLFGGIYLLLLAGPLTALPLFVLWLISRGAWMGLGDAKLALSMGWLLGPLYGFYALTGAFILGALIALCILLPLPHLMRFLRERGIARLSGQGTRFTMKSEVPFGPFLIASTLCLWLLLLNHVPLPL